MSGSGFRLFRVSSKAATEEEVCLFVSDASGQQDRESTIMGGSLCLTHLDSRTENLL